MSAAVQYIIDDKGHKTSVLISFKQWESLNNKYHKLLQKMQVLTGIQKGLEEVYRAKKTGKKLATLKDFLRESNC